MGRRILLIGLGVLVVGGTTVLILYRQGLKDGPMDGHTLAKVLVSRRDIHVHEALDPLIEKGVIVKIYVPRDALVVGAVTHVHQLRGTTAVSLIPKESQISSDDIAQTDRPA
jgi:hypothetical protein